MTTLFKRTLRDVQCMYYDIGACDMKYDEFKEMCHKAWSEKINYLCIDMTKKKMKVNIVFSMKTKTRISNVFVKTNFFNKINIVSNLKQRRFRKSRRVSFIAKSSKSCKITRQTW